MIGRLKRRAEFLQVAAANRKWVAPGLILQVRRQPSTESQTEDAPLAARLEPVRVGFTASRKVGNAVARNRAKRRLRALVDKVVPQLGLESWDLVLIARTEATVRDFDTMADDFSRAVVKVTTERSKERRA